MKLLISSFVLMVSQVALANVPAPATLPSAAMKEVLRWNYKFQIFGSEDYSAEVRELFAEIKQHPATQQADYNGDKVMDYALLGNAGEQQFSIAVVSGKDNSWKVVPLKQWTMKNVKQSKVPGIEKPGTGVPVYLTRAEGEAAEKFEKDKKRSAIQVEAYLGAVELFGIDGDKSISIDTK